MLFVEDIGLDVTSGFVGAIRVESKLLLLGMGKVVLNPLQVGRDEIEEAIRSNNNTDMVVCLDIRRNRLFRFVPPAPR